MRFKKILLRNTNEPIAMFITKKGDFQSVQRSLSTLMFISKISLERMPIDVIRYEPHTLLALGPFKFFSLTASLIDYIFTVA